MFLPVSGLLLEDGIWGLGGVADVFPWLPWSWLFFPWAVGFVVAGGLSSPLETVFFGRMFPDRFLGCRFLLVPAPWVVAAKGGCRAGGSEPAGGEAPQEAADLKTDLNKDSRFA